MLWKFHVKQDIEAWLMHVHVCLIQFLSYFSIIIIYILNNIIKQDMNQFKLETFQKHILVAHLRISSSFCTREWILKWRSSSTIYAYLFNQIQLIVNYKKSEILTVFIEFPEKPLGANVRLVIVWFDVYLFLKNYCL